ncbi:MAG: M20/M25/M40 family metallo-hydrolase, partial [Deltaproteobacteria bacterium]|nr:M20/M25/M40 family metallo-hydrolase [Deltaproteobacteria bacterium]
MKRWTLTFSIFLSVMLAAFAVAGDSSHLLREIEAEVPAFMSTWERIVNIDSGTGDAGGLAKVEAVIVQRLNELGAKVEIVPAKPAVGNCIVGTFKGTGKTRIMMMIHYDTVFQKGAAAKRPFRVEGKRAFGPGVADAKSGVALILHAVKLLHALNFTEYGSLTVLFNPDEEESSLGSRNLIQKVAAEQDYVLS